jgi:ribosomal protein S16
MKIAIQGHPTRGKEVIQLLESLGGRNIGDCLGTRSNKYYYLDPCLNISATSVRYNFKESEIFTLEEFEKKCPFKIGDKVTDHEGDVAIITGLAYIEEKLGYSLQYENGRGTATSGILKPYKEMKEERNITLTLEKAKEWYKKGGELKEIALQAFSERELNPLPKSWEDFCLTHRKKLEEYYISYNSYVCSCKNTGVRDNAIDRNLCPSKESAEAHLAMIQLEQLRDCWRNGWKPEYHTTSYAIKRCNDEIHVIQAYTVSAFLSFPTQKMADDFLACFRDLIEKAGDLI